MLSVSYIDHLQKQNADDLAFYPITTLERALQDKQILHCEENSEPAGYLWHGAIRAGFDITIYQACVDYDARRRHLGWSMVRDLIEIGKASGALGIRLKCASSSEANEFWNLIGFYCTNVTTGGIKRGRMLNHWRTDLTETLFIPDSVEPSTKKIDQTNYQRLKRDGIEMPSAWSRNHY